MSILSIVFLSLLGLIMLGALIVLGIYGPGGGSWVKKDGTIIEWDDNGGCRIFYPNGTSTSSSYSDNE